MTISYAESVQVPVGHYVVPPLKYSVKSPGANNQIFAAGRIDNHFYERIHHGILEANLVA
jgi:hypothetical protein